MFEPSAIVAAPSDGETIQTSTRGMLPLGVGSLVIFGLPEVLKQFGPFALLPRSILMPVSLSLSLACVGCILFAACIYAYLRPVTLIVDRSGFHMIGAFVARKDCQQWKDIERFSLVTTRTGSGIACALRPGSQRKFAASDNVPGFGWVMKGFMPAEPQKIIARLNAAVARDAGTSAEAQMPFDSRSDPGSGWLESQTIESSRLRYLYSLAGWAFAILVIGFLKKSHGPASLTLFITLSPVLVYFVWLAMFPPSLSLDAKGITIPGLLPGRSQTLMWDDLQDFVMVLPRRGILDGPRRIGYFFRPGHAPAFSLFDVGTWSERKIIPSFYTLNTNDVVACLNDYRQRACR